MLHDRKLLPLLFSICLYIHRFTFKARFVLKFNNFGWKHFWGRPGSRYQVPVPGSQACRYLVLVAAVPTRSLATRYLVPDAVPGNRYQYLLVQSFTVPVVSSFQMESSSCNRCPSYGCKIDKLN